MIGAWRLSTMQPYISIYGIIGAWRLSTMQPIYISIYGIIGAWRLSTMQPYISIYMLWLARGDLAQCSPIYLYIYLYCIYIDITTKLNNHLRRDEARDLLLDVVVAVTPNWEGSQILHLIKQNASLDLCVSSSLSLSFCLFILLSPPTNLQQNIPMYI